MRRLKAERTDAHRARVTWSTPDLRGSCCAHYDVTTPGQAPQHSSTAPPSYGPRTVEFKGYVAKNLREKIWPHIEAGRIKPEIYKTFPLEQAAEAHRLMETSQHIGKIVLTI